MRKITEQAISALLSHQSFSSSNTKVIHNGAITGLYLHRNLIAELNKDTQSLKITNAGWFSNTTKERLNALPNVSIRAKQGKWFLNGEEWDGQWIQVK